jgi:hypothetical protein
MILTNRSQVFMLFMIMLTCSRIILHVNGKYGSHEEINKVQIVQLPLFISAHSECSVECVIHMDAICCHLLVIGRSPLCKVLLKELLFQLT